MVTSKLNSDPILKVGNVKSVKGRTVEVLIDKSKNSTNLLFDGQIIKNVSVGSYVKICKGFDVLIGKIEGEFVSEDNYNMKSNYTLERNKIKRVIVISLLGYFDGRNFKRGIKELPLLNNECFLLTKNEFDQVHKFIKNINGEPDLPIVLGSLASEKGKRIEVGINSLFASHIGIFGNTGSGKSYTLAGIYYKLFEKFKNNKGFNSNANFLFIDFNGEYSKRNCITENKKSYNLSTRIPVEEIDIKNKLPLSEKVLLDVELLSILANATEKTQKPFIKRAINFYKKVENAGNSIGYFTTVLRAKVNDILSMSNKDKAYSLVDYMKLILNKEDTVDDNEILKGIEWNNKNEHFMISGGISKALTTSEIEDSNLFILAREYKFPDNSLNKIIDFLYLQLIFDIYNDKVLNEHVGPAINKLKSKTKDLQKVIDFDSDIEDIFKENNCIVINLNDANIDIKKTIPLILSKNIYSQHKIKNRESNKFYLNIIIDEAHNILSYNSERESSTWKDYRLETFEEIIKEGRKFGVFLTVASQRPSDISPTIISQLHNYFLHRLINNRDIEAVERTISYLDKVSFESLPLMSTGTCVLAGLCAQVPVILEIDKIDPGFEPYNETIKPTDFWN